VRRNREPGDVYQERLDRVFYENYVGSIVDWYATTLMRREPMLLFDGSDERAKIFYNLLSDDCDLKGTNLHEFFRQRFIQSMVCGKSFLVVDFPRQWAGVDRAEEGDSGRSAHRRLPGNRDHRLELRSDRLDWVVIRTSVLRNQRSDSEAGERNAVDPL
jgi:hypothetical protein